MSKFSSEEKQVLKALTNNRRGWRDREEIIFWIADHAQPYPLVSYHNCTTVLEGLIQKGFVRKDNSVNVHNPSYERTEKR